MVRLSLLLVLLLMPGYKEGARSPAVASAAAAEADGAAFAADGKLLFPARYREWIFLTSGVDMSYDLKAGAAEHTVFNNVFVNPSAYRGFLETGIWPDKTEMVLENRGGEGARSINTRGRTQSAEIKGLEVHVKDASLPGGWGFYGFDNQVSAKIIARPASCYTCHEQHAAVDTTFVQFYPTLVKVAQAKGTMSAAYLKEMAAPGK
jgi:hypothetical protein